MKRNILWLFILFSLFGHCQDRWQTINYKGVSVQIPSNWGNKNTVNYYEETGITEYQISCWSKEKGMSLVVQWLNVEVDGDLYIESIIENQKEKFPIFREFDYSKIVDVDFLNMKAKKCHFSKYFDYDNGLEGESFAFTRNEHSYIVIIFGGRNFYKSTDYNTVLNSIKPNFLGAVESKEKLVQTYEINDNFTRYEFPEFSLSVPNTMELRNENSFMSLGKEVYNDKINNIKKIDIVDFNFVFQPTGTDDVQNSDNQKEALALYSRVLINYQKGKTDEFFKWNEDITYSQEEYNELNNIFKDNLLEGLNQAKKIGMNMEIVSISNIKIAKNANKFVYIEQQYVRKGLRGNVKVVDYYLYNNNEMVKLTISYRISENNLWETDFNKIIDTFSFTTKK